MLVYIGDGKCVICLQDTNKPMWSGRADYQLVNVVSRNEKMGSLYSWRK